MNEGQIACCAYVSLGFGSPQMQYFLRSLQKHYRPRKPILVCEPHSDAIPDQHRNLTGLSFHRVVSGDWRATYWYMDRGAGEADYRREVAEWFSVHRPELAVLTGIDQFQPLLASGHQPSHLIYYAFEVSDKADTPLRDLRAHDAFKSRISLALFPELNRMHLYEREFGYEGIPKALVYNVPPSSRDRACHPSRRNGRVLMQGTIQWGLTYPEYLLNTQKPDIPIDIYGPLYGTESKILEWRDVTRVFGIRYCGFVPNSELAGIRKEYSYVLVMWNPSSFNSLNACPNKFFEAIASGVPPLCAPHPQCVEIVRKYDCGILMRDWSFAAFCEALEEARKIRGTRRYNQLVRNCRRAYREELNWEKQFAAIAESLPKLGSDTAPSRGRRRPGRFFLVDPGVGAPSRFAFRRAVHVLNEAHQSGLTPIALVNRILRSRLPDVVTTHPVFWHDSDGRNPTYPDNPKERDAADLFVSVLKSALARERLKPGDHLFVPPLCSELLSALADWITHDASARRGCWHILVDSEREADRQELQHSLRRLYSALGPINFRAFCHTSELSLDIARGADIRVEQLPIPVLPNPGMRASRPAERIVIAYLGEPATDTGFAGTAARVRNMLTRLPRQTRFLINCCAEGSHKAAEEEVRQLRILSTRAARVEILSKPISTAFRARILRHSDLLLDLSDPQTHRRNCSIAFAEGICHGKVVLVPEGSWMATQLPGGSPWVFPEPEMIPSLVGRILKHLDQHRAAAAEFGERWRRQHTARNLVQTLTGISTRLSGAAFGVGPHE